MQAKPMSNVFRDPDRTTNRAESPATSTIATLLGSTAAPAASVL